MATFWYSTLTLFAEIVITCIILYVFYSGWKKNVFPKKLAIGALAYEIIFNISYMAYRTFHHVAKEEHVESVGATVLAATHGILSFIMFVALIIFLVLAMRAYRNGRNYFKEHPIVTVVFIVFWMIAVLTGIVFYFVLYV